MPDKFAQSDVEVDMERDVGYSAYLVRLFPTQRRGSADYRVMLESAATGERRNFPDLDALFNHWHALRAGQEREAQPTSLEGAEPFSDGPNSKS